MGAAFSEVRSSIHSLTTSNTMPIMTKVVAMTRAVDDAPTGDGAAGLCLWERMCYMMGRQAGSNAAQSPHPLLALIMRVLHKPRPFQPLLVASMTMPCSFGLAAAAAAAAVQPFHSVHSTTATRLRGSWRIDGTMDGCTIFVFIVLGLQVGSLVQIRCHWATSRRKTVESRLTPGLTRTR